MSNLWAFILLIGPLIFVHELGHLLAAKLVDVKVNRFSLGFGPPLVRFRLGETEYCLAPIPLGGYVSMLGQAPGERIPRSEADRALSAKPLWARFFVLAAGPLANLLLPIVVYFFYFVVAHTTVAPPVVGTVVGDSAAVAAGLQQGDRIIAIDGRDVRSWTEMRHRIAEAPGRELRVQIEREGKRLDRVVTPNKTIVRDALGIPKPVGRLGVLPMFYAPQIGILDPEAPAAVAGLQTGDIITSINGEPIRTREELARILKLRGGALVRLTYLRPTPVRIPGGEALHYTSHHAALRPLADSETGLGIVAGHMLVRAVEPESPAARAGLQPGDAILAAGEREVRTWVALVSLLSTEATQAPIELLVQSPGAPPRRVEVQLERKRWTDVYRHEQETWWFGAHPYDQSWTSDPEPLRGRFTYALSSAIRSTGEVIESTWDALVQMLTFDRSIEELSSVVGIYQSAGTAYDRGLDFLLLVGLLSVNLGFINLLPIPVLDGGHLLFYTLEAIRRRPLGQRTREIASAIGLVIILLLLLVAVRNDIVRYWL